VDNIVYITGACIHTKKTCNTKPAQNYTDRRSWCKLANQGNLGRITNPTYFILDNKVEEMLAGIVIAL
jgi:hypothetical protein